MLGILARGMQNVLWYLTVLSSVWFSSFVNCAATLSNPLLPHLTNSTSRVGIPAESNIPAEFQVVLEETPPGPPVRAIPCLSLGIRIVGEYLAPEDFTEKIGPQRWSIARVVIAISTKYVPGYKIERRFVIWGIYEALELFEGQKNFRSAIFSLKWRGDPVGYLAVYPEGLASIDSSFTSPAITEIEPPISTSRGGSNNSVSSNVSTVEDRELELTLALLDPRLPLDVHSTFLVILGTLCDAAQRPKNQVVPGPYEIWAGSSRAQINVLPGKILNYKWLIKALTMIPNQLPLSDLYSFRVKIWLGTLDLGLMNVIPRGRIPPAPDAFIEAGFNVSAGSAISREK